MALDTLQLSPVVINNDKLVQMAGSLMAKKQAEEKAYENDLINRMAKIDSSGMRIRDIDKFKKMYDEYVNFGSANLKNLNDPTIQVKIKNMENNLRGFTSQSKAAKEEDLKIIPYIANPDLSEDSRSYAQKWLELPTEDRVSNPFDFSKLTKTDNKDYISDVYKGFDGSVTEEIGTTTYKNTPQLINKIKDKADRYIESTLKTPTGEKAFKQFLSTFKTPVDTPTALAQFKQSLVDNFIARAEQSVTQDEPKSATEFDIYTKLGMDYKKVPEATERFNELSLLYKGDKAATESLKSYFPDGTKVENDRFSDYVIVSLPPEKEGEIGYTRKIPKTNGGIRFVQDMNSIITQLGAKKGFRNNVTNNEIGIIAKNKKFNPTPKLITNSQFGKKTYDYGSGSGKSGGLADQEFQ